MSSQILFATALLTYIGILFKTRELLSPIGVFCLLWFSAAAIADIQQFKDFSFQIPWVFETYMVIFISGLSVFSIGFVFCERISLIPIYIRTSNKYMMVFNALAILSVMAVALRILYYGFDFMKIFVSIGDLDLKNETPDAIPFVHYFEILTPFIALCALFELRTSSNLSFRRKLILIAYVFYSIFFYSLVFSASRGTFLIIFTGAIFLYGRIGLLKLSHIIVAGVILISLMSLLSFVRMPAETLTNSYLGEERIQLFLSPIYTYIAFNFENLNSLIVAGNNPTYFLYSLKFLLWPFLKNDYETGVIEFSNFDTLFFNARTLVYPFYHDLGLFGCFLFPALIAIVLVWIGNKSKRNPTFVMLLMALQKPIIFSFFGNYFFGELILFIPLVLIYYLCNIYRSSLELIGPPGRVISEAVECLAITKTEK